MRPLLVASLIALVVAACGKPDERTPQTSREEDERAATQTPSAEAAQAEEANSSLDALSELEDVAEPAAALPMLELDASPPERGCVELSPEPIQIWAAGALPSVAASGESFVIVGITANMDAPELFIVRLSPRGLSTPLHRQALKARKTASRPTVIAVEGSRIVVAFIDGDAAVQVAELDTRPGARRPAWLEIAQGADVRFAPALASVPKSRTIAYTDASAKSMRIVARTLSLDGKLSDPQPVVLPGMGGAAPVFVEGPRGAPRLVFIDPRAGPSPVLVADLQASGLPTKPEVLLVLGSVFEPPEIAATSLGETTLIGYTAIGQLATSAVGLRRSGVSNAATALVAGKGNGRLHVDAVAGGKATVFAADAMSHDDREGEREIHVRVADGGGLGPPLVLGERIVSTALDAENPQKAARRGRDVALARTAQGLIALAFRGRGGTFVTLLRCDDR